MNSVSLITAQWYEKTLMTSGIPHYWLSSTPDLGQEHSFLRDENGWVKNTHVRSPWGSRAAPLWCHRGCSQISQEVPGLFSGILYCKHAQKVSIIANLKNPFWIVATSSSNPASSTFKVSTRIILLCI